MGIIGEKCGNILLNLVELRNEVMGKYISIMCSTLAPMDTSTPINIADVVSPAPLNTSISLEGSSTSEAGTSTTYLVSDDEVSLTSASSLQSKEFTVPSSWPSRIMECIELETGHEKKRALTPSVPNEIVPVLANTMFCHTLNPNAEFYSRVAKMLVKKYEFMRDIADNVSGHVSI